MNQWNEAAMDAADEIVWDVKNDLIITPGTKHDEDVNAVSNCIANHFADLKATYEKFVGFAVLTLQYVNSLDRDSDISVALHLGRRMDKLLADPLVVAEIERMKDNE